MRYVFSILALCFIFSACSKSKPEPVPPVTATPAAKATVSAAIDEEPPEEVLRELMFRQYAEIEKQGGIPATVTASGHGGIIHSKLYEVHKDKCVHLPVDPPGVQECGVDLKVAAWWEGRREPDQPLSDSKRISVIRDSNGVWIDCSYNSDPKNICQTGRKS